ncbi:Sacchrp-dh-NADP domain-containing protein [Mycena venus]|uniref:Sacchrp-dh-NADP domain-containing protein n=1 Tax=Mycena venus TaxID=2733690 RepID=A0A8H6TTY6_9AGAR|nr:Sacchrp-dh-NADP domain-containing protein [Mycena venus]
MSSKPTVLVLGATGFTGKLITEYLAGHKDGAAFTLALGARSKSRLDAVVSSLDLGTAVELHVVDTTRQDQLEAVVKKATVVINTVGPFYLWGTPVVEACVKHGVHYVDLTGETHWVKRIITRCHYTATKTGAIIIPSCGLDSLPADITAYLSSKTLRDHSGQPVHIDSSLSAYNMRGGMSGGTIHTGISMLETVSREELRVANQEYSISPSVGMPSPRKPLIYRLRLPDTGKTLIGATYFMARADCSLVQRSWGLLEVEAAQDKSYLHYGPAFKYDEFFVTGSAVRAVLLTLGMAIGVGVMLVSPLRWLLKKSPPPNLAKARPNRHVRNNGFLKVTNLTTAVPSPDRAAPLQAKTVLVGQGDPGYKLTSGMCICSAFIPLLTTAHKVLISEAGLSLALNPRDALPAIGRRGGVLTPATALGDVLVDRLATSGRVTFESKIVSARPQEGKKTV